MPAAPIDDPKYVKYSQNAPFIGLLAADVMDTLGSAQDAQMTIGIIQKGG